MTQINVELQEALIDAGAKPDKARAAAAVAAASDVATKADLADLKAELTKQHYSGLAIVLAAIAAAAAFG